MSPKKVLITGATGFIGKALVSSVISKNFKVVAPVRKAPADLPKCVDIRLLADLSHIPDDCDWFDDCDSVIHLAGKAHLKNLSQSEFTLINTTATLNLANRAAEAGVRRFIFLSSIGVNGINSKERFSVNDKPAPVEDYAFSKLYAEKGLKQIALDTGMQVVIIRPPLVYGANAPGNFGKFAKLGRKNLPLPLGSVHNKRSLVSLDNLIDLILTCIDHPNAANQTFLVSDDHDVSTTELLTLITRAAGKKPWLIPVPINWLKSFGRLTGKQAVIDRLCGNLQVDISHTKETLGWKPPISLDEGIKRCFEKL